MDLPPKLLLGKIKEACTYRDKYSKERTTGKIKPKYKLMRSIVLGQYFFNVLTKCRESCRKSTTIAIHKSDWINKDEKYLNRDYSYCDITKYDIIDESTLLKKIQDKRNAFPYVGKLCTKKYNKLKKLHKKIKYIPRISRETKSIVEYGLMGLIDENLKDLGLD